MRTKTVAQETIMGLHIDYDDLNSSNDFSVEDDIDDIKTSAHKKDVRRRLNDRLELRRLKNELEDYDGELDDEFNWDEISR